MALVQISPIEAHVRWDRHADRPAEVRWNGPSPPGHRARRRARRARRVSGGARPSRDLRASDRRRRPRFGRLRRSPATLVPGGCRARGLSRRVHLPTIGPASSGPIRASGGDRTRGSLRPMDERLTELTVRSLVERLATQRPGSRRRQRLRAGRRDGRGSRPHGRGAHASVGPPPRGTRRAHRDAHRGGLAGSPSCSTWPSSTRRRTRRWSSRGGCRRETEREREARAASSSPPPFARRPASRSPRPSAASRGARARRAPRADRQPQRHQRRRRRRACWPRAARARRRAERPDQPAVASPPTRSCGARRPSEIERLLAGLDERERAVRDAVAERLR